MDRPLFGFLIFALAACNRDPEPVFPPSNQPYSGYPQPYPQPYPQQQQQPYAQPYPQQQQPQGDPLAEARQYTLARVNGFRAQAGRAPLRLDDGINAFSQAASQELSQDHTPHRYFQTNWSACSCRINAENQGDWNGVPPAPVHHQIDEMLNLMISEGPGGGHYENMLSPKWTRMGAGIVNPGGMMYFTTDFGP
jgi:uncharacterized protein YkwD